MKREVVGSLALNIFRILSGRIILLYIPTYIPPGYRFSAVWLCEKGYIIILVYSKDGSTYYRARPGIIGVEISPARKYAPGELEKMASETCNGSKCQLMSTKPVAMIIPHAKIDNDKEQPIAILYLHGFRYIIGADTIEQLHQIINSLKPIKKLKILISL